MTLGDKKYISLIEILLLSKRTRTFTKFQKLIRFPKAGVYNRVYR